MTLHLIVSNWTSSACKDDSHEEIAQPCLPAQILPVETTRCVSCHIVTGVSLMVDSSRGHSEPQNFVAGVAQGVLEA